MKGITFKMKFVLLILLSVNLVACSKASAPNIEPIQDMLDSPAIKAQEYDEDSPNHSGMRVPPTGTQPVGFTPYKYAQDLEGAIKNKNPMAGDFSEDILKTGLKHYTIQCALCHGVHGEGGLTGNSIGDKMPLKPPALTSDKIKSWSDGQIYHVITVGQGMMGPYGPHIPEQYRWQVVNYIRHLQK